MKGLNWQHCQIVLKGALVGAVAGSVVSAFRWLIELMLVGMAHLYHLAHQHLLWLGIIILINLFVGWFVSRLMLQNPNIKGSGIPQVEGQLRRKWHYAFAPVLWRKFIGGVLAIGSGLFLGREGPSIQLGSTSAQGVAKYLHQNANQTRLLIAGGAAAGLAAAFNAPIASTIFVLEEIYHRFETLTWMMALSAALVSNLVSTVVFGQVPVLHIDLVQSIPIHLYPHVLLLGICLGLLGLAYQFVTLRMNQWYQHWLPWLKNYLLFVPLLLVVPIGMFMPQTLGGGNQLILLIAKSTPGVMVLLGYLLLRFIFSSLSYGTGSPGGIFLPILSLGAVIGGLYGQLMVMIGWFPEHYVVNLIVIAMAGYFGAISKSPFTAILLVTEMVGTLEHLMAISLVTVVAYLILDLFGGRPIYDVMLEQLLSHSISIQNDK